MGVVHVHNIDQQHGKVDKIFYKETGNLLSIADVLEAPAILHRTNCLCLTVEVNLIIKWRLKKSSQCSLLFDAYKYYWSLHVLYLRRGIQKGEVEDRGGERVKDRLTRSWSTNMKMNTDLV